MLDSKHVGLSRKSFRIRCFRNDRNSVAGDERFNDNDRTFWRVKKNAAVLGGSGQVQPLARTNPSSATEEVVRVTL